MFGCTLPNLAKICQHKPTNYKFYPFCEHDKDLCENIREDMTGGPSIVFTRKPVFDETYIRNSSNVRKSFVGIDASQLYSFSMCQDMPTGLYTRWEFDTDMQKFKARNNQTRKNENLVMSFYQKLRPECDTESFFTSGKHLKKLTVLMLMVTAITVRLCLKQWDVTTTSVPVKKLVPP